MGTDALGMVEKFDGKEWRPVIDPIWPNARWKENNEDPMGPAPVLPRHYGLFSVLADVRNNTGRGRTIMMNHEVEGYGVITVPYNIDDGGHDPLEYIDVPRGVPADCNQAWKEYTANALKDGSHDPTWLTLRELDEAPWDQRLYEQAVATEDEYLHWVETGEVPRYAARGVGGEGVRTVTEVEYAAGIRGEISTAVDFRWSSGRVRDSIHSSWWAIVAMMHIVNRHGDPDNIRLLVLFDS